MSKLTKCSNQHFYEAEKYDTCPFCEKMGLAGSNSATVPVSKPAVNSFEPSFPTDTVPVGMQFTPNGPTQKLNSNPNENKTQNLDEAFADSTCTVAKFSVGANGKEPVVGWLVAVEGKHKGEDFRLKAGNNFIGRDRTMDVVLSNDNSVSRNKHAIITYDPMGNVFIVRGGESHELSYLNGQILLEPKVINNYDKLLIGNTTLMFISLVGDKFTWEK